MIIILSRETKKLYLKYVSYIFIVGSLCFDPHNFQSYVEYPSTSNLMLNILNGVARQLAGLSLQWSKKMRGSSLSVLGWGGAIDYFIWQPTPDNAITNTWWRNNMEKMTRAQLWYYNCTTNGIIPWSLWEGGWLMKGSFYIMKIN